METSAPTTQAEQRSSLLPTGLIALALFAWPVDDRHILLELRLRRPGLRSPNAMNGLRDPNAMTACVTRTQRRDA